jgi:hypothetical protein
MDSGLDSSLENTYGDLYTTTPTTDVSDTTALIGGLILLVLVVVVLIAMWRVFRKAGKPGWAAIVPIYNSVVLLQIIKRPIWWVLLLFLPIVNLVVTAVMAIDLAKAFGKGSAFGFLLNFLFSPIGQLILAFGGAQYQGGGGTPPASGTPAAPTAPVVPPAPTPVAAPMPAAPAPTPPATTPPATPPTV